ncbi:type I-E CRISPR-associated protein Cse1/CasA [Streptomyces sp. NPDC020996]|uniref:type I-E CRISPR-associated protein Cse1/CasA n=1 Tax=Streptomyces sp. NPDC020996 TaxID=3154791 RepID=UPI00340EE62A
MTPSFPLTSAPWITVYDLDAHEFRDVGLAEALTRAHRLNMPVIRAEDIPLLRFLVAVFDAAAGPRDVAAWDTAWKADTLDTGAVTAYLETWTDRLDLFHPVHPALQSAALTQYARGPEALHPGSLGGDGGAWFNPELYQPLPPYPAPHAAQLLLHLLTYDVAGIKRAAPGDPATQAGKVYGSQTGPVASSTHFHVFAPLGTLKHMLLLNLPPQPRAAGDTPVWERDTPTAPMRSRPAAGRLDLLTWPTRRIRLHPTEDGTVDAVAHHDGDRLPDAWPTIERLDPMTAWATSKGKPHPFGFLGMDGWPQPWRGALLLDDGPQHSAVLRHITAAVERGTVSAGLHLQGTLSTTVHTNRHRAAISDIPLATVQLPPAGLLAHPAARAGLATMARYAEAISRNLRLRTAELSRRPMVQVAPRMQLNILEGAWGAAVAKYGAGDPDGARALWRDAVHEAAERRIDEFPLSQMDRAKLRSLYLQSPEPSRERPARPAPRAAAPSTPAAATTTVRRGPAATRYEVFGGSFTLSQLSQHPDCVVSYKTLRDRVAEGWDVDEAATTPGRRGRKSG